MKQKYILLFFYLILVSGIVKAQDTLSNYMDRVNYIFANVDHSKVTTGLLSDYGLQIILPAYYNGAVQDSNEVDINVFRTLYGDMDNSRFNNNCTLPSQNTVFDAINSNLSGQPVPIASIFINYNELYTNADSLGLVTVSNDQIFDVAGANPYATKILFAACPLQISYKSSTIPFVLKSALYYTNAGKTITSMTADMGDGTGAQTVNWDVPFTVSYPSVGNKSFMITFTFSDGTVLQTHGKIAVNFSNGQLKSGNGNYYSVNFTPPFPATTYDAGAVVSVCLNSNTDGQIHKPFIVAKGFDPWAIFNDPKQRFTVNDFLNTDPLNADPPGNIDVGITGSSYPTLESYLYNNGYDIVFVDYNDGTDDITRNALLLEDVIKWVNNNKVGSTSNNVVMGISMGGLVARYALRQLETQGYNHQTQIYISMDSPHEGANVPPGVQAALIHIASFGFSLCFPSCISPININLTITPATYVQEVNQVINLFNTTAAKQMLIYNVSGSTSRGLYFDNSVHQSFMNSYNSLGFPLNCYSVAISDGSGNGTLDFPSGAQLLNYSQSFSLNWWESLLSSVASVLVSPFLDKTSFFGINLLNIIPGQTQLKAEMTLNGIASSSNRIYHGRIYYKKKILWIIPVTVNITNVNLNAASGMQPVDGAPGGTENVSNYINLAQMPSGLTINQPQFCFVPAVSALALNNWTTYLTTPLNNNNFVTNGETQFQDYYRSMPNANNVHTNFNAIDGSNSLANYIRNVLDNAGLSCTATTTIQNTTFTQSQTITGCNLFIQNVSIQNNSSIILNVNGNVIINGPFEVQTGSSFQAN